MYLFMLDKINESNKLHTYVGTYIIIMCIATHVMTINRYKYVNTPCNITLQDVITLNRLNGEATVIFISHISNLDVYSY